MAVVLMFLLMLLIILCCAWYEYPEAAAKKREEEAKALKAREERLQNLARQYGADSFIKSIELCQDCSLDTVHNLLCYDEDKLVPAKNIESCFLRDHYETRSKAASAGLRDGIIAGITGCGIIRDASTLTETYATGKVVMEIKFVNADNQYQKKNIMLSDVAYAKKLKNTIDCMANA